MNRTAAAMSVFDEMAANFAASKDKAKSTGLTPVGLEKGGTYVPSTQPTARLPEVQDVFLTNEAIADIARDLRSQAEVLIRVADGLDQMTQTATQARKTDPVQTKPVQPFAGPVHGDHPRDSYTYSGCPACEATKTTTVNAPPATDFEVRYAEMARAAQAATFADATAEPQHVTPSGRMSDWECPDHGTADLDEKTSRRGRKYLECACGKFEPA